MIVAATALANECVVVTANERHFQEAVELLNPLIPVMTVKSGPSREPDE